MSENSNNYSIPPNPHIQQQFVINTPIPSLLNHHHQQVFNNQHQNFNYNLLTPMANLNQNFHPSTFPLSLPVLPNSNDPINPQSSQLFKQLKQMIYDLASSQQIDNNGAPNSNQIIEQNIQKQIQNTKNIISLNHQLHYCREVINTQEKKIKESEENWQKTAKQNQNKYRKEIKKYIDLVNDKQNQIQNLKKNIKSLTNRCQTLTNQIQSLNTSKNNLQNTITKSIQSLKSNIKQLNYNVQQNQLDKVVLEGKYKQLCDKMQNIVKQLQQNQINRVKLEKKYEKIKEGYQSKKYQCVELKFQIEKYRIKVKQLSQQKQNNLILNKNQQKDEKSLQTILELKQKTITLIQLTNQYKIISQSQPNYSELFTKLEQCLSQNNQLKKQLEQKYQQCDDLQYKIQGSAYDNFILQERRPSLYQELLKMKENIGIFQIKVEELENTASRAQEIIKKKVSRCSNCLENGSNSKDKNGKTKAKVKNEEIIKQFEQILMKQRQKFDKQKQKDKIRVKQLQNSNSALKKQNETLKSSIETLQKQKSGLKSIIQQITQQVQPKRKGGRTKAKIKCQVCSNQLINATRADKCANCLKKVHSKCLKDHLCFGKFDQEQEHSSQT